MEKLEGKWYEVYEKSRVLWENKDYDEAQKILEDFWEKTQIKTLPQTVLYAYILRSKREYITLINFVKETLEIFKNAKELNLLAILLSILAESYQRIGKTKKAAKIFLKSAEIEPNVEKKLTEISNAVFARGASDFSAKEMDFFYEKYRSVLKELNAKPYEKVKYNHKKIRVGYLSADLHNHPVADFSAALFLNYNPDKFIIYVYNLGNALDEVTKILKSGGGIWRDVFNLSFSKIADMIRGDEIDILVDLSGHTSKNALPVFKYKPAALQISGIGYVLSTGLRETDGFLTDIYTAPEVNSPYFTEKLYRLNHSHFCYTPFKNFPEISTLPYLKNGYVTFGSFNNFSKVTDEVLIIWNEILNKIPHSKMILKHSLFDSVEGLQYTKKRMELLGISAEKFEFRGFGENYLSEYSDIDIALDTFPYNGGATSLEALMMGVPVVTLGGNRHGSRFGVSFLKNLNLNELIAKNEKNYVEIAVTLASDTELLASLRKGLRNIMLNSPLMDRNNYMKELEKLYENILKCV
ncbi:MAG: hypothetical protein J6I62_11085 [Selenomonadaceae bacterium]|nr:hypothetical protein [Selenomonadaceae bacterium]